MDGTSSPQCGQRLERRAEHESTAGRRMATIRSVWNAFDVEGYPARIALYRDATFELGYTRTFDIAGG